MTIVVKLKSIAVADAARVSANVFTFAQMLLVSAQTLLVSGRMLAASATGLLLAFAKQLIEEGLHR